MRSNYKFSLTLTNKAAVLRKNNIINKHVLKTDIIIYIS